MNIPPFTVIRSKRKTLGLQVTEDGRVVVRAPLRCPKAEIACFVEAYSDWIEKKQRQALEIKSRADAAGCLSEREISALSSSMKKALPEKLRHFASLLKVSYGKVTVRCQKTKWGSCSSKGNLNFNCLLMLAPESVLDYVVVHELCHLIHPDHSMAFWAEVERILPGCKQQRAWLKNNGGLLMARAKAGEDPRE